MSFSTGGTIRCIVLYCIVLYCIVLGVYSIIIYAGRHGSVTMACDLGLRCLGYGCRLPRFGTVSLGKILHLYVHSLDPGVNGYLIGQ